MVRAGQFDCELKSRSICENFVEAGFNVPKILSNGLAVADKLINKESEDEE